MEEKLPGFVLAELFGSSLIDAGDNKIVQTHQPKKEEPKQEKPASTKPQKNYLGNYEKKIIVLVNDDANVYVDDDSLNFLSGILNACKLNLAHIALMNFNNNAFDFNQLKKDMQPAFLIMFGMNTLQVQLPFDMPDYQVQDYNNCKILTSPSLQQLNAPTEAAKAEKGKLWKSLKTMFDLGK